MTKYLFTGARARGIPTGYQPDQQSDLEATFDYYWRIFAQGQPRPVSQYKFGRYRIDKAWPEYKIAVELNGGAGGGYGRRVVCQNCGAVVRAKKGDGSPGKELRLPHPSHSGAGAERDAAKANALQAAGWMALTFTSHQFDTNPESCIQDVMIAIRKAQATGKHQTNEPIGLTRREAEILSLVCRGLKFDQIADQLGIAPGTVNRHAVNIRGKLEARNFAEGCAKAIFAGELDQRIFDN